MTIRFAIVGCKWVGRKSAESLHLAKGAELTAVADLQVEEAARLAREAGIGKWYASDLDVINDPQIDAVIVCVATHFHYRVAMNCIRAGKHVMIEKPPAVNAAEVKELQQAAQEHGVILSFNYQRRHHPAHVKARERIASGKIGKIYHGRAAWLSSNWTAGRTEWLRRWDTKGGALGSLGSHYLDFVWFLMGSPEPRWAYAAAHTNFCKEHVPHNPGDDFLCGLVGFDGGITISIETSQRLHRADLCYGEVFGSAGSYSENGMFYIQPDQGKPTVEYAFGEKDSRPNMEFIRQIEYFAGAIRGEHEPMIGANEAYQFQSMLDALYESVQRGEKVPIGQKNCPAI